MINNHTDLCETIYNYVVIEDVGGGLYARLEYQELFKVDSITTIDENGKEYYNSSLRYEPITTPVDFG